ncbi:MAG TPA: glutamate 5-kinase [Armatimonadota bacterium]|jgi:glutamate 5-kinase
MERKAALSQVRRLVVKIGTRMLAKRDEPVNLAFLENLAGQLARLRERDIQTVLVVSGAVTLGRRALGLQGRTEQVSLRQAAAAVGQPQMMHLYMEALAAQSQQAAQILLTADDMADRSRYLRIRNTLEALLEEGVVPILNENDSVSVEGVTFGENDRLAAIVAAKLHADALIFLSDQAGLLTADPREHPDAELISLVHLGDEVSQYGAGAGGEESTGGMTKKLAAAQMAIDCGIPVVMADGSEDQVLLRILGGEPLGTFFLPGERVGGRKLWIATAREPAGRLVVDEGASRALTSPDGASLLPIGVVEVEGDFEIGDVVEVLNPLRHALARGLTNYSADELRRIKRLHSREAPRLLGRPAAAEVIHRDNMVVSPDSH